MTERDPLVLNYSVLKDMSRTDEALLRLKKIASMTKPIMRNHGWKVPLLAEFYPSQHRLLGINENRGERVCLRLRYAGDKTQFLPIEQTIDTFLHELSHNLHGPHDANFHALWNQLRSELEGLLMKGYTGEGFLSKGHVVGGGSSRRMPPPQEVQRLRRAADQNRRRGEVQGVLVESGHRLGGSMPSSQDDIRAVIAKAAESRLQKKPTRPSSSKPSSSRQPTRQSGSSSSTGSGHGDNMSTGCGNVGHSAREVIEIVDDAVDHGFRTKAEEDEANDAAIARALAEELNAEHSHVPVPGPGEWACPRCTLLNPMAVKVCQVCEFESGR